MKQELLTSLIPIFLNNHPNSGIILPFAWHIQGQSTTMRTLVMHAMAEWYMRDQADQVRTNIFLELKKNVSLEF